MKWMAWLLLVLNIALFGYFELSRPLAVGDQPGHESIQPELLHLLTPDEVAAMPKPAATSTEQLAPQPLEQVACYEWGSFPANASGRAKELLQRIGQNPEVRVVAPKEAERYWVYIPPQKSQQEAQARVDALHQLGIQEAFIVQAPQWRHAISLGLFKDEALATRLAQDLRGRGVTDVVKAARNPQGGQSSFYLRNLAAASADEIRKAKPDFPYSELKQVVCE